MAASGIRTPRRDRSSWNMPYKKLVVGLGNAEGNDCFGIIQGVFGQFQFCCQP